MTWKAATVPEPEQRKTSARTRFALAAGAVLVLLGVVYAVDVLTSRGAVPRGVAVSGVEVGGLDGADAEAILRRTLTPRSGAPVGVRAGDVTTTVDARAAGLTID